MSDAKSKQKNKAKKAGTKKSAGAGQGGPSIAAHPRAREHVRRAKRWGGLGAFLIAAYVSLNANVPLDLVALRALIAGAAGFLIGWACSVTIWRHLMLAELRALAERSAQPAIRNVSDQGET